ncbi:MAG: DNA polymerase I [Phycisphaerales bacterium JB043]
MRTLYLIDGHAQFFRAFHAIRTPMSSPVTKEPTNATYGFVGMLLKLLRENKPDYVAVAIDVSGDKETFRSEIYPEYKANRESPPESFRPQVDRCVSLLEALRIPIIGVEGYEADDVIATIVDRHSDPDLRIRIVSKDKDLQQLLESGHVEMYDAHKDEVISESTLFETKGIAPSQVVDMLALMGDNVDNVPGVPGIGPKTAAALIAEHATLDALLERADDIKGKRGENIRASRDMLGMSQRLVTLVRDVPMEFSLDSADVERFDLGALMPLLKELGFNRYQDDLKALVGGEATEPTSDDEPKKQNAVAPSGGLFDGLEPPTPLQAGGEYHCVRTKTQLNALCASLRKADLLAIDTETTSTIAMRADLCGISLAIKSGEAWYVPVRAPEGEKHLDAKTVLSALAPIIADETVPKTGHNLKYDILVLRRAGVELRGMAFDSMVASFVIDSVRSSHGMDPLSLALLGRETISIKTLIGTGKNQRTFDTVPLDDATIYAAEDADVSLQLRNVLAEQLEGSGLETLFQDVEMPLVDVLAELEWNGIRVDPDELRSQEDRLRERIDVIRASIEECASRPFNPDSPKQLSEVLFNAPNSEPPGLGIKPLKKTKTGFSTDVEVLEKLDQDPGVDTPLPGLILEYRSLTKLVSTYLVALREAINPETQRVHASFHQTGAATGRLSSSDPNLQNIPIRSETGREIRRAFKADEGNRLITADYSQIELRILAHLAQDEGLIDAFRQGSDIHREVAAQIHGVAPEKVTSDQRSGAKMVNFGIVYGITPFGLARRLGVETKKATEIIEGYKHRFKGIDRFLEECMEHARTHGYVETMLGRRRPVEQAGSRHAQERALGERVAINSVVQGSAADLIKLAMIDLHRAFSPHADRWRTREWGSPEPKLDGVRMLLQIHDELVFECPSSIAEAARALIVDWMEGAMELRVPLVVDASVSEDWYSGK